MMEFNFEQLKLILFWSRVKDGELSLKPEEKELADSIKEYLVHWNEFE